MRTIDDALRALAEARVVAAATESFFGLLVDAASPRALDALARLKPRGLEKGIPLILPNRLAWAAWASEALPLAERLADAFWPGPLTIGVAVGEGVDPRLTQDGRIAVRLPGPSLAAELARRSGKTLTATSANLPGMPPATRDEQVERAFARAVEDGELVVVPGSAPGGAPSTVVVVERDTLSVARAGAIPTDNIARALGLHSK
jgi:L-threonylcarbamoyladenylate synthase